MECVTYPKVYLYRRIVQAKLFIDSHYAEKLDVNAISDEANFSKFHFIRQFKKIYGKTPHQHLIQVRLEQARRLLKLHVPVSDVCFLIGFDSISSFSGLFKRFMGITPSHYQKGQLQREEEISRAPLRFIPHCFAESNGWTELLHSR